MLQPEGVLTDWIPLKAMMVGNGFGVFMAPTVGEACEVDFQEGDASAGSAGWRFFNNVERPLNVPAGEIWLVHSTGASIKMATSGSITLTDPSGTILQLANNGAMAITGNVTVSGSVTAAGEVTGNGKHLSTHTHSGVTPGGGTSGAPV